MCKSWQRWLWALGTLALGLGLWAAEPRVTPTPGTHDLAVMMRAKSASTHRVVEGLVMRDFGLIRKGGDELRQICDATQWRARDDQVYAHHRAELRRQARKLVLQAEERNLDGCAYVYMKALSTCIDCHEHCRDVLHIATLGPSGKVIPIPATDDDAASRPRRADR